METVQGTFIDIMRHRATGDVYALRWDDVWDEGACMGARITGVAGPLPAGVLAPDALFDASEERCTWAASEGFDHVADVTLGADA